MACPFDGVGDGIGGARGHHDGRAAIGGAEVAGAGVGDEVVEAEGAQEGACGADGVGGKVGVVGAGDAEGALNLGGEREALGQGVVGRSLGACLSAQDARELVGRDQATFHGERGARLGGRLRGGDESSANDAHALASGRVT